MSLVLAEGEKIYYTRDYCKGRRRSVGNVTVTDKRLVSTVESKAGVSRNELPIDEVAGLKMKFRPTSVLAFIATGVYGIVSGVCGYLLKMAEAEAEAASRPGMVSESAVSAMTTSYTALIIVFALCAVACLIAGLISLRNGLYIKIQTQEGFLHDIISINGITGRVKPLRLKPKKEEAFELLESLSVALTEVRKL